MQRFQSELRGRVRTDEPLSKHTSFKVGGPADVFFEPADEADLLAALRIARADSVPVTVLGEGSNVVVSDRGVRGLVLRLRAGFDDLAVERDAFGQGVHRLALGGGLAIFRLIRQCRDLHLAGMEYLVGVPGSVGGAVRMNAGTYAGEVVSNCESVTKVVWAPDPQVTTVPAHALRFRYRHADLGPGEVVVRATFRVTDADAGLDDRVEAILARRKASQPVNLPSVGSVFKNPPGDHAGRLIEAAGLKGVRRGGAEVSPLHGNFIVNAGGATAADMMALVAHVQAVVSERFGVPLEREVQLLGEWPEGGAAWP